MRILSVVNVKINKKLGYGYLEEIVVRRADKKLYTFKEGDFKNLHLNHIEDMLILHVQNRLSNLEGNDVVDLVVALRMFTRILVIKKRVEDVQLEFQGRVQQRHAKTEMDIKRSEPVTHHGEFGKDELYKARKDWLVQGKSRLTTDYCGGQYDFIIIDFAHSGTNALIHITSKQLFNHSGTKFSWKSQAYAIPEFFQNLPEQVCDLYYLQVLLLHGCEKLVSLPKSFAKLVNLRHLDISDTPMLNKLPSGIGGMARLQVLSKVIIEGSNRFNISKLKGMMELRGRLSIEGLHKVKEARQVEEFELHTKHLEDLVLEWSDVFDDSRNKEIENEVFEKLKPHREPRELKILYYGEYDFLVG
ncbi:putative disease resistance RPP13-like protein 1 [Tanacetum coccineum]